MNFGTSMSYEGVSPVVGFVTAGDWALIRSQAFMSSLMVISVPDNRKMFAAKLAFEWLLLRVTTVVNTQV